MFLGCQAPLTQNCGSSHKNEQKKGVTEGRRTIQKKLRHWRPLVVGGTESSIYPKEKTSIDVCSYLGFSRVLFLHVRKQSHEASALDGCFDLALLFGREIRLGAAHDAAVRVDELLEQVDVFVIDVLDIVLGQNVIHILVRKECHRG